MRYTNSNKAKRTSQHYRTWTGVGSRSAKYYKMDEKKQKPEKDSDKPAKPYVKPRLRSHGNLRLLSQMS